MIFCANYTKTVVFCCAYCHIVSYAVKRGILWYRLITRFKGYLRHFMVLWYIYTLTHINTLKRAYKHVTRVYKHFTHWQYNTLTGILYTCWQVNRWTHWQDTTKRGHNTHKAYHVLYWHKQNTIWLNPQQLHRPFLCRFDYCRSYVLFFLLHHRCFLQHRFRCFLWCLKS